MYKMIAVYASKIFLEISIQFSIKQFYLVACFADKKNTIKIQMDCQAFSLDFFKPSVINNVIIQSEHFSQM